MECESICILELPIDVLPLIEFSIATSQTFEQVIQTLSNSPSLSNYICGSLSRKI